MNRFKKFFIVLFVLLLSSFLVHLSAETDVFEIFYFNDLYEIDNLEMELYDLDENKLYSFLKEESLIDGVSWHRFWLEDYTLINDEYIIRILILDEEPLEYNFRYDEDHSTYYLKEGEFLKSLECVLSSITYATFINRREIRFFSNSVIEKEHFRVLKGDVVVENFTLRNFHPQYIVALDDDFDFTTDYYLEVKIEGFLPCLTYIRHDEIYNEGFFNTLFKYDGDDLGATFSNTSTNFKVWAPTLGSISLNLYNTKNEKETYVMEKGNFGVFSYRKLGNLKNYEYTFSFTRNNILYEIIDPYAKYISNNNRGLIIDYCATNPTGFNKWKAKLASKNLADYVIYESSIKRSTGLFSEENLANTYNGLTEHNLTASKNFETYSVGLDYLKDLGITHLSLNDLIDTTNSLGVINREYSSDLNYGTEIKDLKQMIKTLGDNGIGVILDLNIYQQTIESLESLLPGYYYETYQGVPIVSQNNSFFETNNIMTNNYIESQILFLISEFKFSGLKLSPLNSLNIDSLNDKLRKVASDGEFIIYGEFSENTPTITHKKLTTKTLDQARHIGFIDENRFSIANEFISSSVSDGLKGYILSSWNPTYSTLSPEQSFKRLDYFKELSVNANKQIKSVQLLSYGVLVLKAGEEIGLYDEKPLDYYYQNINNSLFNMYKQLISFRKEHASLKIYDHTALKNEVVYNVKDDVVSYEIVNSSDLYPDILIIHNFGEETNYLLPEGLKGFLNYNRDGEFNWKIAYDNLNFYNLGDKFENNVNITLQKNQSVILHFGLNKENIIEDPIKSPNPPDSANILYYLLIGGGSVIIGGILITYFILRPPKKKDENN